MYTVLAILFFVVAVIKFRSHQVEHFWTHLVAALWFGLQKYMSLPDAIAMQLSITSIAIILMTQIISPIMRWYWRNKK